jgi:hypothetical protein
MSAKSATLAKSLHTVSVLVSVAREIARNDAHDDTRLPPRTPAELVNVALCVLGYVNASDPYGLAARAVAQLSKDVQS